jgi:hypothetical protein
MQIWAICGLKSGESPSRSSVPKSPITNNTNADLRLPRDPGPKALFEFASEALKK